MPPASDGLLGEVRVLDVSSDSAARVGRLLADLGADVIRVVSPQHDVPRRRTNLVEDCDVAALLDNANKRRVSLDPADAHDRHTFNRFVSAADIVIGEATADRSATFGRPLLALADEFPRLVVLSVTDFGVQGPKSMWRASDASLYALSSVLSRSGMPGGPPVLPPDGLASATAAAQAAWAVLVAYHHRLDTGTGDVVDFSRYEATLQALDPPFGAQGQAAAARGATRARRGRPTRQDAYPIFPSADGYVRICLLAPRQWRAMRSWLGEPTAFQNPDYDHIAVRAAAFDAIGAAIASLFAEHTTAELVAEGTCRGVPIAAVMSVHDVHDSPHFRDTGAWTAVTLPGDSPDAVIDVPDGPVVIDGIRSGIRSVEQTACSSLIEWPARVSPPAFPTPTVRPFDGLRILDLGVIVAGGELGRLFADLGADVVKIESPAYPDGLRQAPKGHAMSASFAWTHRNQSAMGLDMRSTAGAALFSRLVGEADAVFANFKPGTLASLGFSYDELVRINPRVVLTESSAYGAMGPWTARMGYGPLVRASTGITRLWTAESDPTVERLPFCDAVTVFPDHIVARLAAVATLGALIRRRTSGRGAHIHVSQAETAISALDVLYTTEWARAAGMSVSDDHTVHAVSPCAGDDEWCVVTIGDHDDWHAVAAALDRQDVADDARFTHGDTRWQHRADVVSLIADFTRHHRAHSAAAAFQRHGIAAAPMQRGSEVLDDPQVVARGLYSDMAHPLLDVALPAETGPARFRHIPPAELRPAPLLGEHSRAVCQRWLGMRDNDIDDLIGCGALFDGAR